MNKIDKKLIHIKTEHIRYVMLDLFTIFSKGGIVLWCFQGTCQSFTLPVNELIRSVILQVSFNIVSGEDVSHGPIWWFYKASVCFDQFYRPKRTFPLFAIIQERGGNNSFTHGSLTLKYKLDNEFELVFVVSIKYILNTR